MFRFGKQFEVNYTVILLMNFSSIIIYIFFTSCHSLGECNILL